MSQYFVTQQPSNKYLLEEADDGEESKYSGKMYVNTERAMWEQGQSEEDKFLIAAQKSHEDSVSGADSIALKQHIEINSNQSYIKNY
jgi:hypothetical protein